jgi:formamidopyrimidine-DNA glycosylase
MPELPEVEVTRRGLLPMLTGRTVIAVSCSAHRLRRDIPRRLLKAHVQGQEIRTVDRRAKYLLIRMASGAVLLVHLGMTGKFSLLNKQVPRHRHDHLILGLENDWEVRLNDSRRFGSIDVWPEATATEQEDRFSRGEGIEPLGEAFTPAILHMLAKGRRIPVKSLLMHAKIIAGIGNIYANETLFAARIHPQRPANQVTLEEWQRIVAAGQSILHQAIDAGGSSIADFLGAGGHPGYFQLQFQVYGRKDQACTCCGAPISKIAISGRATYLCPHCQPM